MDDTIGTAAPPAAIEALLTGGVEDPNPLYEVLRETDGGVHFSELLGGWLVTRYADVRRIAQDHATFSSDIFFMSPPGLHDPDDALHRRFIDINSRELMFSDPPRHTRLRSIFRHAFTPGAVTLWRPLVEDVVDRTLDRFRAGEEIELMTELAAQVPVAVIASMLGVDEAHHGDFRRWSYAFASTFDPLVQGEHRDRCIRESMELLDHLAVVLADRREHPADDVVSLLASTPTDDGDRLEDADLLAQLGLLLVAGNETTTNLVGNGVTLLLDHPQARQALIRDPDLLPAALEEVLRFDPPLHLTARRTTAAVTIGGREIPENALVVAVMAAANRDPRVFERPDEFDIGRAPTRHLSFFHGIHFCVGAHLARTEGDVVFRRLLERFPGFSAGAAPPTRRTHNAIARGWATRPLRLETAP